MPKERFNSVSVSYPANQGRHNPTGSPLAINPLLLPHSGGLQVEADPIALPFTVARPALCPQRSVGTGKKWGT